MEMPALNCIIIHLMYPDRTLQYMMVYYHVLRARQWE